MVFSDLKSTIAEVEAVLAAAVPLPDEVVAAVEKLLNVIEALVVDKKKLADEVKRLRLKFEKKKKSKTTNDPSDDSSGNDNDSSGSEDDSNQSDHSSEEQRRKRRPKPPEKPQDRRSYKDLPVHETIECPIDPVTLPEDAIRVQDEKMIVQGIEIKPKNIHFQRQTWYSPLQKKFFRAPLPAGFDRGHFSAELRSLIISLKYSGNMSEPKIRDFLENFGVQVSGGSISNILTDTASDFEQEYDDLLRAGLQSTSYQQTDDTSARVKGSFWHTHILCNPFYSLYSTRPQKDRLTILKVLQNRQRLQFRFGPQTLALLEKRFAVPEKWLAEVTALGEIECGETALRLLLDGWFGTGNVQVRTAIEQAAAICFYRTQNELPVIETLVCDDAGQFKLLTSNLSLCWIHAGRHYHKLSPLVNSHRVVLDQFLSRFWDFYRYLREFRESPNDARAGELRLEFDELFSTITGYDALDARIAKTHSKKDELLTVLSHPQIPLHNNASELGARVSARRRDVSLHSRSERGARAMDIFTSMFQTAKKLGISSYEYLHDRISKANQLPFIAQQVLSAATNAKKLSTK